MVAACCDSDMTGHSIRSVIHMEDSHTPAIYHCVFTDVAEDCSAFISRVGQPVTLQNLDYELSEILANVKNCLPSNSAVRPSSIAMYTAVLHREAGDALRPMKTNYLAFRCQRCTHCSLLQGGVFTSTIQRLIFRL